MKHSTIIAFLPCGTSPPLLVPSSSLHASLKFGEASATAQTLRGTRK